MRKVNFLAMFAAAALMMGVTSCDKNEVDAGAKDLTELTIRISNPATTKALEPAGESGASSIELDYPNSIIYVVRNLSGEVAHYEFLDPSARTTGQTLSVPVPSNAKVYIVANIPSGQTNAFKLLGSLDAIKAATSNITTQDDYKKVALANSSGDAVGISLGSNNTATVSVNIKPLISRMELVQVKGGSDATGTIKGFTVKGVYVDSYHSAFKYNGDPSGNKHEQGQSINFSGVIDEMKDEGTWIATGTSTNLIAKPASPYVWAYNVASGGLPRFIIKMDGITYTPASGGADVTLTDTYYVTVSGYSTVSTFLRGQIYRVGGDNGIIFGPDDLGETPNAEDVALTVNVTITGWNIVNVDPIL